MKPYLASLLFGFIASAVLLIAGFWTAAQLDLHWLNWLIFGPGESLFFFARRIGLLTPGELGHHVLVVLVSLLVWTLIFGFLVRRLK